MHIILISVTKKRTVNILKWTYKVMRSLLFTAVIVAVAIFAIIYVLLAIPPVQKAIKERVEKELTATLGSNVEIGNLSIIPANEVLIEDVRITDLAGKECLNVGKLGAGINLWRLIFSQEIEITFVELLNFKADIYQEEAGEPFNIQFIIDAFQPKDKNKPPTRFDLKIHNIVVRNGDVTFSKNWQPRRNDNSFDPNHIAVTGLSGDITIPRLSNDLTEVDLRRLALSEKSGFQLKELSGFFRITPENLKITNLTILLPESEIRTKDLDLPLSILKGGNETIELRVFNSMITPSNLSAFWPPLADIDVKLPIQISIEGNKEEVEIKNMMLGNELLGLELVLKAKGVNLNEPEALKLNISELSLLLSQNAIKKILAALPATGTEAITSRLATGLGEIHLRAEGNYSASDMTAAIDATLNTGAGNLKITGETNFIAKTPAEILNQFDGNLTLEIPSFDFKEILPDFMLQNVAETKIDIKGLFNLRDIMTSNGEIEFNIGELGILNHEIRNIEGSATKLEKVMNLNLNIEDQEIEGDMTAEVKLDGENSEWSLLANIKDFDTYNSFLISTEENGYEIKGTIGAKAIGNRIDNMSGTLCLSDFMIRKWNGKQLEVENMTLTVSQEDTQDKNIDLESEIIDFNLQGNYELSGLPILITRVLGEVCPAFFPLSDNTRNCGSGNFSLAVKDGNPLIEFFDLPVIPLTELTINGNFDSLDDRIALTSEIPYIQQGSNKLITDTYLDVELMGAEGKATINTGTVYPTKKGLLKIDMNLLGDHGSYSLNLDLNKGRNVAFYGDIAMNIDLDKDDFSNLPIINVEMLPSQLHLNRTVWNVEESEITYTGDLLKIRDFCIRHDDQYVFISGSNDKAGEGTISVTLADIDLDFIFGTLNIPHVTFGGSATGAITARQIFSKTPDIHTERLFIKDMSYNEGYLGDGDVTASLDLPQKKVAIGAEIKEGDIMVAKADGGIWIGRDSLAFAFEANRVSIAFMQPFMEAFSSKVTGRASGKALLYGTFSDIDMTGKIFAEDIDIQIDYINASYGGTDTVYLYPGRIDIPRFRIHDKYGHRAVVTGELTHNYFHDPVFKFNITDMDNLLVYDTNSKINPLWYGTIFASGAGEISGRPGIVTIAADVETTRGSDFTFVLSDQQEAVKSHFLTFTDRRKELELQEVMEDTIPDFLRRFYKDKDNSEQGSGSIYKMDFRVSVTDDVKFNLIMDPVAGDKITAYGDGAMNMTYTSLTDELRLYGKYTLDKGTYNFSLQDIILKDFTIKPGSSIVFRGDPYSGELDITAAYRVNTSLTELDQSFANDRELNRTSVPVEALLKVSGPLTTPTIDFDIDLPTVTEETARKVKSIISTDDMMSRQVLYLVALNKFYPPEYMTTSNSGGEWASIASSTLSSQIQNMIGQITDKFTLAPSIRSDKGDFSDIEVDIALSSQLFNNRLLLNGNIGYRDPSNSSTTFVGDFDLEYLLNQKGTWRLKAYNHFNDQNYYLKSALTTQGIGIVWRRDFGLPRKKEKNPTE